MVKALPKKRVAGVDRTLFGVVAGLFIIGLLVLYSASTVESFKDFNSTTYYITHQLLYGGAIGLVCMLVFSRIDYKRLQPLIPFAVIAALVLLILVKVPGLGFSAGGATRWIHMGPIVFQPSEIAKLVIILYIAGWIAKKQAHIKDFTYGVLPSLFITVLFASLILWQPDVGTMLVLLSIAMVMLFAGGIDLRYFTGLLAVGAAALLLIIKFEPYRAQRLVTFLNPSFDPLGIGYQINQALLAIGAGGFWGYGYGLSRQKHNYLPETLGDSIFAVTAEELGFLRIVLILGLFLFFALKGMQVARRAPDTFGRMLAVGITSAIIIQVIINVGAIIGLLPLTGIPLPFFSYGSSALIITLAEVGILLNISRHTTKAV